MSVIDDVLLATKEGILQGDVVGWKKVESARAELAQLRADLQAAQERIAELEEPLEMFSLAHDLATASIDSPLLVRYAMQLEQRIAWLTSDIGESGLAAINRLIAACERGDIAQQAAPDLSIARDEILRQARQLEAARNVIERCAAYIGSIDHGENTKSYRMCDAWLAANPAPTQEPSVAACTACGTPPTASEHDPTCPLYSYAPEADQQHV